MRSAGRGSRPSLDHPAVTLGYGSRPTARPSSTLTDHEPFSDKLWRSDAEPGRIDSMVHEGDRRHARFMAGADLVIHDAQYTPEEYESRKTWGHSTYEYVVEVAAAAGVKRVALTHHDPNAIISSSPTLNNGRARWPRSAGLPLRSSAPARAVNTWSAGSSF